MNNIQDIFRLITFVIPGFIAYKIYGFTYGGKKSSDLETILISIINTIIIHILLDFSGFNLWEMDDKYSVIDQAAILLPISVVFGLVLIGSRKLLIMRNIFPKDSISVWGLKLRSYESAWIKVKLKNAPDVYFGWIESFSTDPNKEDQDFFLKDVILLDNKNKKIRDITGEGVYLNTRDVSSIEVWSKHS